MGGIIIGVDRETDKAVEQHKSEDMEAVKEFWDFEIQNNGSLVDLVTKVHSVTKLIFTDEYV